MDDDQGRVHSSSDGGVTGQHPQLGQRQIIAGPSTADQFNRVDLPPTVVGFFRVDDIRFAFDSSFVTSNPGDDTDDIRAELRLKVCTRITGYWPRTYGLLKPRLHGRRCSS
jgi:hypothetical protein